MIIHDQHGEAHVKIVADGRSPRGAGSHTMEANICS